MPSYKAPLDDIRFVLDELLDVGQLAQLPGYEEMTGDVLLSVLEEGGRLCEEVLAPINQAGDAEGCRWENGVVTTPKGFKDAYRQFVEGGWPAMIGSRRVAG